MDPQIFYHDLDPEVWLRLGGALVAGFLLGMERESHGRAAGLRTTMLVTLSSCVAMLVSNSFYLESLETGSDSWHPDPARLAAGILAGMGFLGAGVIIHERTHVIRGVTTAATIWLASIIGIAIGAGSIGIGLVATLLSVAVLSGVQRLENRLESDWYADLTLRLGTDGMEVGELEAAIREMGMIVKGLNWKEDLRRRERTVRFHLMYKKSGNTGLPRAAVNRLSGLPGMRSVEWHA